MDDSSAHTEAAPSQWRRTRDGILYRVAARVVIFDDNERVFLVRGHDSDDISHAWWFTVGGGICEGEDARHAAQREMREETGLRLDISRFEGPVLRRKGVFRFAREVRRQDEEFFLVRLTASECARVGQEQFLTLEEQDVLDEFRWWLLDDLRVLSEHEPVYPSLLPDAIHAWYAGWDGVCLTHDDT